MRETKTRLTDGQALAVLGVYLVFRAVTQRLGLGFGPRLLEHFPWVIPLLNNSSLLLIQAGTGTHGRTTMLIATAAASVVMSTIAGLVLYWAGWRFGHKLAELSKRPGSMWAGVWNPKQIARAERWLEGWGTIVVFLGKVIEYFTLPVVLVAGATSMRLRRFLVAHTLGSIAFAGLFLWIGGVAQRRWPWLKDWIADVYGPWALRIGFGLLLLLVVMALVSRRVEPKTQARAGSAEPQPPSTTTPSQEPSASSPPTD